MIFNKLIIKNYKCFQELIIDIRPDVNILVGNNESGKSTILEAINIALTCKLNGKHISNFLNEGLFNYQVVRDFLNQIEAGATPEPPKIIIELYSDNSDANAEYKGKNNYLNEDVAGISFKIEFDTIHATQYKKLVADKKLVEVPLEFYKITWKYFKGDTINVYNNKHSVSFIDTSKNSYSYLIDNYIGEEISQILTEEEMTQLSIAYRNNRGKFSSEPNLKKLNDELSKKVLLTGRQVSFVLYSLLLNDWKGQLSLNLDNVSYLNSGRGTQNILKTNLALSKNLEKANILLIEEPENNLSFSNMAKLIANIIAQKAQKQIFIATHSNYVANKLGLDYLILLNGQKGIPFKNLPQETVNYFRKLPGYDTLRMLLSDKAILVEGPTEELLIQRAYMDLYNKLPIEDGLDIISVRGLSFKRFCDIAVLVAKPITIITDNDGDVSKLISKYSSYSAYMNKLIFLYYESNPAITTVEYAIFKAQTDKGICLKTILGLDAASDDDTQKYMVNNKTTWALKVFEAKNKINYPEYILNAIKK